MEGAIMKQRCLLCPPNPHNIIPIYSTLTDFISLIETSLECAPG